MQIKTGKQVRPRRVMLYGIHGVGKSTWAAQAPRPLFLDLEDGLGDIDCDSTQHLKEFGDVVGAISWLISNDHEYQTLAIDTADWLERLILRAVAAEKGKANVEEIGYGKGYKFAGDKWRFLLDGLTRLWSDKQMHIIFLAHADITPFDDPEGDRFDRYEPKLHDIGSAIVQQWCDEVFFASTRVIKRSEDTGFNRSRNIAVGTNERYIRTEESAAVIAKNRLEGLPREIPMQWSAYAEHFPRGNKPQAPQQFGQAEVVLPKQGHAVLGGGASQLSGAGDIGGIVVDGSSKGGQQ